MADDARFLLFETSDCDSRLGVAQIDEGDDSFLILGQVCLSEEAVIVAYGRAFIDHAEAL